MPRVRSHNSENRNMNKNPSAHELAFIEAFVKPNRRDRWREMLAKPKKRKKFVAALDHTTDIDERHAIEIPPSSQSADEIIKALKDRGAPRTCYAISSNPDLDGKAIFPLPNIGNALFWITEHAEHTDRKSLNDVADEPMIVILPWRSPNDVSPRNRERSN